MAIFDFLINPQSAPFKAISNLANLDTQRRDEDFMGKIFAANPDFAAKLYGAKAQAAQTQNQQALLKAELEKQAREEATQKSIADIVSGGALSNFNPNADMPQSGNPSSPLANMDTTEQQLTQLAMIQPDKYTPALIEYRAKKAQAMQPDIRIQEVGGQLVQYDANNPNPSVKPIYTGVPQNKPLSDVAKLKADFDAGLIDKTVYDAAVKKSTERPPRQYNQAQNQAAAFADRMVNATSYIEPLESKKGFDPVNNTSRAISAIPSLGLGEFIGNAILSPEQQQYKNAASEWIRAKLRKESGAAIGVDEMAKEYQTYFPMPGDSKEVIQQKSKLRQSNTEAMKKQASGAYEEMYGAVSNIDSDIEKQKAELRAKIAALKAKK